MTWNIKSKTAIHNAGYGFFFKQNFYLIKPENLGATYLSEGRIYSPSAKKIWLSALGCGYLFWV